MHHHSTTWYLLAAGSQLYIDSYHGNPRRGQWHLERDNQISIKSSQIKAKELEHFMVKTQTTKGAFVTGQPIEFESEKKTICIHA